MAEPATAAATLPPALQTVLTYALALGGVITPPLAYFWPRRPKPPTDDSKAVTAAVIAPIGDPNQLRQVIDGVNRLGDFAEHGLRTLDEIKDEAERTTKAAARAEEAASRVEAAILRIATALGSLKP